jgi:pimeloyl-ACP methyl ester carboxylesterase
MKFLFNDESFSFETLRGAGFSPDGGADLGEIIATASAIAEGDDESWHREWKATADRIARMGAASLNAGHAVSAREAFLRASNYYRMAEFYRRENPFDDPEVTGLIRRSRDTFKQAAALMDGPVEDVRIPYGDQSLPAYLFFVDGTGKPRPTVIYNNGFDSTREEAYCVIAAAALRRGYNVIAFDGPGQGAALREDRMVFRPDWEAVITPVLDYAASRREFAAGKMALFGYSLGAYLAARAGAFERRLAALILDDGMYDFFASSCAQMPPFLVDWIRKGDDAAFNDVAEFLQKRSTNVRWALKNGMWTFGARSYADFFLKTMSYTLEGVAEKIVCPTLVMEAEADKFAGNQAMQVSRALRCPSKYVLLKQSEGAGEHCHMGAMRLAQQVIFDWLDEVLAKASQDAAPARASSH